MRLFILLFIIFIVGIRANGQAFRLSDFYEPSDGMLNEQFAKKNIQISEKIILPASIRVTSKGNGELEIANLSLRVYDAHDDTAYYKDALLDIYFVDINGDSRKDLIAWGINVVTPNKEEAYLGIHPVIFVALFRPETKTFLPILSSPIFKGYRPLMWDDYSFQRIAIPFLWGIYFVKHNGIFTRNLPEPDNLFGENLNLNTPSE